MERLVYTSEPILYRVNLDEPVPKLVLDVLRKYNMSSYKLLTFSVIPELRHGRFDMKKLKKNKVYELVVPFDNSFTKLYGLQKIMFNVKDNNIDMLIDVKTEYVFRKLYSRVCRTYKGVPIIDDAAEFKSRLLL